MPLKKNDAASRDIARRGGLASGRWKDKNPETLRTKSLLLKLSAAEYETIDAMAKSEGVSRVELVVQAVQDYKNKKTAP